MTQEYDKDKQAEILIVEDSFTQAEKLKYYLTGEGYRVQVAGSAEAALDIILTSKPHAIISDIIMPGMNGYELCKRIKDDDQLKDIPVVLLTSLSKPQDVLLGLECGADYFIEKSNDIGILIKSLRESYNRPEAVFHSGESDILYNYKEKVYEIDFDISRILSFLMTWYEVALTKENELLETETTLKEEILYRRNLEKELKEAKKKAELNDMAKSIFLANMSHEIRTPMNAVLGYAQLLLRDPSINEQQRQRIQSILSSGEHLLSLINDILDLSKIEAGKIVLKKSPFNLINFLNDIERMFRIRTEGKNLSLIFERDDAILSFIKTDEGKLRQIIINLLSNAVKFTDEGGIAVRAKTEYVKQTQYKLIIEVEDTGPGINEDDVEKVFEIFQQSDEGYNKGGTGLGLALSKKFAVLLGGDITIKSKIGVGSLFCLEIDVEKGISEEPVVELEDVRLVSGVSGSKDIKVLVVDDKIDNRNILCDLLESCNFSVREAVNGLEAVKTAKDWVPDLILMDLKMPLMDGYQATVELKKDPSTMHIDVVMVTATAFEKELDDLMSSGAQSFIRKPYKASEIFIMLHKYLNVPFIYYEKMPINEVKQYEVATEELEALSDAQRKMLISATINAQIDKLIHLIEQNSVFSNASKEALVNMAKDYSYEKLEELFSKGGCDNERN